MIATETARWPSQTRGLHETLRAVEEGCRAICVTSPTGGGKSLIMADLAARLADRGLSVGFYTNRRLLTQNLGDQFSDYDLSFGIQAADYEAWEDPHERIQICSLQTHHHRIIVPRERVGGKGGQFALPQFDVVIRDEAHLRDFEHILREHKENGATVIGFTATPLGIGDFYERLVIAGTKQELFGEQPTGHPALIPVHCTAIEEPDLKKVGRKKDGEFVIDGKRRQKWTTQIVGNVIDEWKASACDRPTLMFAPGVPESRYLVDRFNEAGISAAHIDATSIYWEGRDLKCTEDSSRELFASSRDGSLKVISSRFKLREGINLPWISYAVFACPVGSLLSYLQMVGRLMRYHPDIEEIRIQDHGGNYWRHPSPNHDIPWEEYWDQDLRLLSAVRKRRLEEGDKRIPAPLICPHCRETMGRFPKDGLCRRCGKEIPTGKPIRRVRMLNGKLKDVEGYQVYRNVKRVEGGKTMWKRIFWSHRKNKPERTFGQAWGWFVKLHLEQFHCYPPRDYPLMPSDDGGWFEKIGDVDFADLIPEKKQ